MSQQRDSISVGICGHRRAAYLSQTAVWNLLIAI